MALRLFTERGFDQTTVDDIAAELRIGRRTLFHYFASKNDMVWGNFDGVLEHLRAELAGKSADSPMMDSLREAVVTSNSYAGSALEDLRIRMTLITTVPALQAHSMLRYESWRAVVAEFAAARLGCSPTDMAPRAIGYAALAASTSAFTYWVGNPREDLLPLLECNYRMLAAGFAPEAISRLTSR